MKRAFSLGAVLTVTTGYLLTTDFVEVHQLLDFLTGEHLYSTQLPRALEEAGPGLKQQLAWTSDPAMQSAIDALELAYTVLRSRGGSQDDYKRVSLECVDALALKYGSSISVEPLPPNTYRVQDPMLELLAMAGDRA